MRKIKYFIFPMVIIFGAAGSIFAQLDEEKPFRQNPFVPVFNLSSKQSLTPNVSTNRSGLHSFELKGIIKDNQEYCAILRHSETGKIFITKNGKLLDSRRQPVKNILVAQVAEDKVVLKQDKQSLKFMLKKEE